MLRWIATAALLLVPLCLAPPIAVGSGHLDFDGQNDYVVITDNDVVGLDGLSQVTFSFWISPRSLGQSDQGRVLDKGGGSALGSGFTIALNPSAGVNLNVNSVVGDWSASSNVGVIALDIWQHVAVVYDGSLGNVEFYVDGVFAGSDPIQGGTSIIGNDQNLVIGARSTDLARQFDGSIDTVRIWDRAFLQSEVQAEMNSTAPGAEPGLVAYYRFDEDVGQMVFDYGGNGNAGKLGSTLSTDDNDPTRVITGPATNQPPQADAGQDQTIVVLRHYGTAADLLTFFAHWS
jgi:hypothetical protein